MQDIVFKDEAHKDFYIEHVPPNSDVYLKSLVYTLGLTSDTRRNFKNLYDAERKMINPESIHSGWQTGTSARVTRLAFNLFTDGTPTVEDGDIAECSCYSVIDIFCCGLASYFFEAIKIRYPEYTQPIFAPPHY